jgi:hypothetical protein
MRVLPLLIAAFVAVAATGCAASSDDGQSPDSDESNVTSGDREIARIGGGGTFAVADDGAYLVFDNALYRIENDGTKTRLADAPDKQDTLVLTDRYVVLAASPLSGDVVVFYDRKDGFKAKEIKSGDRAVELLPAANDRVIVSFINSGLVVMDVDGNKDLAYTPKKYDQIRDLSTGPNADIAFGTVDTAGQARQLIEVNVKTKATRVVFDIDKGSFAYIYDPATKTFFADRQHNTYPSQSILVLFDDQGRELKRLETPMNDRGAMAVDRDGFYLAARPGMSPGVGSWKLFAFDKKTLEMSDRGRVEPQTYQMRLRGKDLFYSDSKDAALPLRRRTR